MGIDFTPNEWLVVGLVFLLGLLIGAALAAGGGARHKLAYREEAARRAELERDNDRLRKDLKQSEIDTVSARARAPVHDVPPIDRDVV
jgi:protein involved in polysaccharide export with SLBB domain